jgi:hypothetical protein
MRPRHPPAAAVPPVAGDLPGMLAGGRAARGRRPAAVGPAA